METSFFGRLPGYALFRGFTQRLAAEVIRTCGSRRSPKIEDALVPAFIVEELDDGRFTVFVPSVPTPFAGAVYILSRERVHLVDIPFTEAIQSVSRWGAGSKELVAAVRREALFETQCRNDCLRIPPGSDLTLTDQCRPPPTN